MKKLVALAVLIGFAVPLFGADNHWLQEYLKRWNKSKEFTVAVAEKMPADGYSSMPNPEEMDFGKLITHIAQANSYFMSCITGKKMTPAKPASMDKAAIVKFLGDSFDWSAKQIGTLTDLDKMVKCENQDMSVREALLAAFTHIAHHRGQAEVYLRFKNIKPPDYMF
jgi:uncharacterized damage-inducible protein DinB